MNRFESFNPTINDGIGIFTYKRVDVRFWIDNGFIVHLSGNYENKTVVFPIELTGQIFLNAFERRLTTFRNKDRSSEIISFRVNRELNEQIKNKYGNKLNRMFYQWLVKL